MTCCDMAGIPRTGSHDFSGRLIWACLASLDLFFQMVPRHHQFHEIKIDQMSMSNEVFGLTLSKASLSTILAPSSEDTQRLGTLAQAC